MSAIQHNPFIVMGKIPAELFCDRETESRKLIHSLTNGNNVVLISPRRMGKTGLIHFCYDNDIISDNYYTFFVDILHTSNLREFTYNLGRCIYKELVPKGKRFVRGFIQALKSISGKFSIDALNGSPTFGIELGDINNAELTLEEIFNYLENAGKPCIMSIDEFQQVTHYPEKNIEALLRGHIQNMQNCRFVFAGSERSIMQNMFTSSARPFYQSADLLELNEIPFEKYSSFVNRLFNERQRFIGNNTIKYVYELFRGHTFYMQKVFNEAFSITENGKTCDIDNIKTAINTILGDKETTYMEILSAIPEKQKPLLYAIADEGVASHVTSIVFSKKHNLDSASSIQSAIKQLLSQNLITEVHKEFSVTDKFFALWINRIYNEK
ncbi:MAG: ATPase [Bacteroidales bacterium]|nr:ATPase [Bacteroidales bacterium]